MFSRQEYKQYKEKEKKLIDRSGGEGRWMIMCRSGLYISGVSKKVKKITKENASSSKEKMTVFFPDGKGNMIIGGHLMVEKSGRVRILTKAMVVQGKKTKRISRKKEKSGQQ